jgi:hypothetical protein
MTIDFRHPTNPTNNRYTFDLLVACQSLHGEACGSGCGNLSREEVIELHEFVRMRVETWQEAAPTSSYARYDAGVLELCRAVLEESRSLYEALKEP